MVLANGEFVTVSSKENPDLYWAIRGGGGNFGVVTSFLFKLHPVDMVYAGPTLYPLEKSTEALKFYREFMKTAPNELTGFFLFLIVPPAPPFPPDPPSPPLPPLPPAPPDAHTPPWQVPPLHVVPSGCEQVVQLEPLNMPSWQALPVAQDRVPATTMSSTQTASDPSDALVDL